MTATAPPGQPQTQPHTATLPDSGADPIHRIAAPLIAQGWRRRDAIRRARAQLERELSAGHRPDPYRNHHMRGVVHTDGTAPTALWDIERTSS